MMAEVVIKYIHRVYATVIIDSGRTYNSVMERDKPSVKLALEEKGYNVDEAGEIYPI
ncbi:hypothetical protein MNQ98_24785 [Paenibacillus sp. N3/727]|uniref:hypothetical protein n=1 Tax=Paenibacillus sp. N3/727 TaxID=2925845 RepID=UPI001F535243|nr:hypothetical protein [Paenibacillus sp. N3/727]UNK17638.1 hypothetical protein MNQ98_24785 [Paenibacillus sp. N3/727]